MHSAGDKKVTEDVVFSQHVLVSMSGTSVTYSGMCSKLSDTSSNIPSVPV